MAAEPKTRPTGASVAAFVKSIADDQRRKDCQALVRIMKHAAGAPATMWGTSIVGFGSYTMTYANGGTLDWPIVGFSPRKHNLTIYVSPRADGVAAQLRQLGRHKLSGGCLHITRLSDVDV